MRLGALHLPPTPSRDAGSCPQRSQCPVAAPWLGGSAKRGSPMRAGTPGAGQSVHTHIDLYILYRERLQRYIYTVP